VIPAARAAVDRSGPPLCSVRYPAAADCLWRWVEASADAAVSAFVADYLRQDAAGRRTLRAALGPDELETLVTFARRRALAAIRTGDPAEALAAFDAVSAVDLTRIDWRDVWVAAALTTYAVRWTGREPAEAVRGAAGRADPEVAALLTDVTADPVDLADECGYRVWETPVGRVLVDDDGEAYAPTADLVGQASQTAALLERDRYRVDRVTVATTLPDRWLHDAARVRPALRRLTGCAQVDAVPAAPAVPGGSHFLLVFLAEAADGIDAATIAEAAASNSRRDTAELGVAVGRHCAVIVAGSPVVGLPAIEDPASLARFAPQLTTVLAG